MGFDKLSWVSLACLLGCQSGDGDAYFKLTDMESEVAGNGAACKMSWALTSAWDKGSVSGGGVGDEVQFADLDSHETMLGETSKRGAHLWSTDVLDTTPAAERPCQNEVSGRRWGANLSVAPEATAGLEGCPFQISEGPGESGATMNLSDYSGLVFWAKATTGSMENRLRVMLPDSFSQPRGEGQCIATNCIANVADKCWNPFSTTVDLTDSFVRYEVDFSAMGRDPTWGKPPSPDYAPDLKHVYSIAFQVDAAKCAADPNAICAQGYPPLAFDVWIDDVYLVKHRP